MADLTALRTDSISLTARAKLPDDLTMIEYIRVLDAISTVCREAESASNLDRIGPDPAGNQLFKAQYGSDFLAVLGVASLSAGVLVAISHVVRNVTASIKDIADLKRYGVEIRSAIDDSVLDPDDLLTGKEQRTMALERAETHRETVERLTLELESVPGFDDAQRSAGRSLREVRIALDRADRVELPKGSASSVIKAVILLSSYKVELTVEETTLGRE